ncbi:MAG: c-type cytochrome, partial [Gammaproteobacteria bacterium]
AACAGQAENPLSDMRELTPATMLDSPEPVVNTSYPPEQVNHGRYLVELLGCASCHTDGALVGEPDFQRHLAGSGTGIAYSNPMAQRNPGVVYPPNLTPDPETGLGNWTDTAMINMIRSGTTPSGGHSLPVMPWPAYAKITDNDVQAIVAYLRSLPPVHHRVPDNVAPGRRASAPFVYFGVYQSTR